MLFWIGDRQLSSWLGPRVFGPLDEWLYPRMHGAIVSTGPPVLPLLMLSTTGRNSGRRRSVPLIYLERDQDFVVVASNWGRAAHPQWSSNLLICPCAEVEIGRQRETVRARLAAAEEKAALWPRLLEVCPVWGTYASRSGRDLRVFILQRAKD